MFVTFIVLTIWFGVLPMLNTSDTTPSFTPNCQAAFDIDMAGNENPYNTDARFKIGGDCFTP